MDQVRLAVLIDADNAQAATIQPLLEEIAKYGIASVRRAYGDWSSPRLAGWKEVLNEFAIQPFQQFQYTTGKNSTDVALIIDAMDLLYTGTLQGFCIVSSDSDFTRLATRLRESGMKVYGFGKQETPSAFVRSCDDFVFIKPHTNGHVQNGLLKVPAPLKQPTAPKGAAASKSSAQTKKATAPAKKKTSPPARKTPKQLRADTKLICLLTESVKSVKSEDGWSHLGKVGDLTSKAPGFSLRQYGYATLRKLIAATDLFVIENRKDKSGRSQTCLRDRQ